VQYSAPPLSLLVAQPVAGAAQSDGCVHVCEQWLPRSSKLTHAWPVWQSDWMGGFFAG